MHPLSRSELTVEGVTYRVGDEVHFPDNDCAWEVVSIFDACPEANTAAYVCVCLDSGDFPSIEAVAEREGFFRFIYTGHTLGAQKK